MTERMDIISKYAKYQMQILDDSGRKKDLEICKSLAETLGCKLDKIIKDHNADLVLNKDRLVKEGKEEFESLSEERRKNLTDITSEIDRLNLLLSSEKRKQKEIENDLNNLSNLILEKNVKAQDSLHLKFCDEHERIASDGRKELDGFIREHYDRRHSPSVR